MPIEIIKASAAPVHRLEQQQAQEREKLDSFKRGAYLSLSGMDEVFALKVFRKQIDADEKETTKCLGKEEFGHLFVQEEGDVLTVVEDMRGPGSAAERTKVEIDRDMNLIEALHNTAVDSSQHKKSLGEQIKESFSRIKQARTGISVQDKIVESSTNDIISLMATFAKQDSSIIMEELFSLAAEIEKWKRKKEQIKEREEKLTKAKEAEKMERTEKTVEAAKATIKLAGQLKLTLPETKQPKEHADKPKSSSPRLEHRKVSVVNVSPRRASAFGSMSPRKGSVFKNDTKGKFDKSANEHPSSLLEQLNKLENENTPRFLSSRIVEIPERLVSSEQLHTMPQPPSLLRRPSLSIHRSSALSKQSFSEQSSPVNQHPQPPLRGPSMSIRRPSMMSTMSTAKQSFTIETVVEEDSEGDGIIMIAKPKKKEHEEVKVSPTKPKIFSNEPKEDEQELEKKKMLELDARLQKLMRMPQKKFDNDKKLFSKLNQLAERKLSRGFEGCFKILSVFKSIQSDIGSNSTQLENECKKTAFLRSRIMKYRFDNLKFDSMIDRFENDIENIRKTTDIAIFDGHMKKLSEATWFLNIISALKEFQKKSKSNPLCCYVFLYVIMQMISEDIPLNISTFYTVMEETVTDKDEHKKNSILYRILKSVRELPFVGVDADKFLQYFKEKGVQPNPMLLVEVRAIRNNKRGKRGKIKMKLRNSFTDRPGSRGPWHSASGMMKTDLSIASLFSDVESEMNDDDDHTGSVLDDDTPYFTIEENGEYYSGLPSRRDSYRSDEGELVRLLG